MKLNKIGKVWNSTNSFLSDFIGCCHPKFCYHGNVTQQLLSILVSPEDWFTELKVNSSDRIYGGSRLITCEPQSADIFPVVAYLPSRRVKWEAVKSFCSPEDICRGISFGIHRGDTWGRKIAVSFRSFRRRWLYSILWVRLKEILLEEHRKKDTNS